MPSRPTRETRTHSRHANQNRRFSSARSKNLSNLPNAWEPRLLIHWALGIKISSFTLRGRSSHAEGYIQKVVRNIYHARWRRYSFLIARRLIYYLYAAHTHTHTHTHGKYTSYISRKFIIYEKHAATYERFFTFLNFRLYSRMLGIFVRIRGKEIDEVLRPYWGYSLNALHIKSHKVQHASTTVVASRINS